MRGRINEQVWAPESSYSTSYLGCTEFLNRKGKTLAHMFYAYDIKITLYVLIIYV